VVVSNENCGLTISKTEVENMNESTYRILKFMKTGIGDDCADSGFIGNSAQSNATDRPSDNQNCAENPIYILGNSAQLASNGPRLYTAKEVAAGTGLSVRRTQECLLDLERRGLVRKVGVTRGVKWQIIDDRS